MKSSKINFDKDRDQYITKVSELSVLLTLDRIRFKSPILSNLEKNNELILVGAMYSLITGEIRILN